MNIWNTIVSSNTFNFIVMLSILYYIAKKINLSSILENAVTSVKNKISESENAKNDNNLYLKDAQKSVDNLDSEINTILSEAKSNAENLHNSIINNAKKQIEKIEGNVAKIVELEERKASSELIDRTMKLSNKLAFEKVCKLLEENPNLHEQIIDECIEQLGKYDNLKSLR